MTRFITSSALTMSLLYAMSVPALAMLPTPEPEMDTPTTATNAQLVAQGTTPMPNSMSNPTLNPMAQPAYVNNAVNSGAVGSTSQAISTKTVAIAVKSNGQGQLELTPADASTQLKSGDMIEYRTYLTNNSSDRVRAMTVTSKIPDGFELVGNVYPDTQTYASIDDRQFNRFPLRGQVGGQMQEIPLQYYKQLRWTLEGVGLNETAVVGYRLKKR